MNTGASSIGPLAKGKLSLVTGLRACAEELWPGRERRALQRLASQLEQGEDLEEVLKQDSRAPSELQDLVWAGTRSGRLGHLLEEYLYTTRESRSVWRQFFSSLFYPLLTILLALVLAVGLVHFFVPMFKEVFTSFGVELPFLTQVVLNFHEIAVPVLVIFLVGTALLVGLHKLLPGRSWRVDALQQIPFLGSAWRMTSSAEFASRLSVLVDARMPLPEALELLSKTLRDPHLREVSRTLSQQFQRGQSAEKLAFGVPGLSPALAGAFRWSCEPEAFAEGLRSLATVFAVQARIRLDQLSFFLGPVLLFCVGGLMGTIVFSLFLPMMKLLNELS